MQLRLQYITSPLLGHMILKIGRESKFFSFCWCTFVKYVVQEFACCISFDGMRNITFVMLLTFLNIDVLGFSNSVWARLSVQVMTTCSKDCLIGFNHFSLDLSWNFIEFDYWLVPYLVDMFFNITVVSL